MKVLYKELYTWEIDVEELINWLNTNKDIIISYQTNNSITLKWKWNGAGFHLCIYKTRTDKYRYSGKIHIKDHDKDEVIKSTMWKIVDSATEMITILEKLIDNLTGMQRYMMGKKVYGD